MTNDFQAARDEAVLNDVSAHMVPERSAWVTADQPHPCSNLKSLRSATAAGPWLFGPPADSNTAQIPVATDTSCQSGALHQISSTASQEGLTVHLEARNYEY